MTLRTVETDEEDRSIATAEQEGTSVTEKSWPIKDPNEVLDYTIDWSARLNGDTISSSEWIRPIGITGVNYTHTTTTTKIWLSGGTKGATYKLTNRVVTAGARIMDQTVSITIADK